MNTKDFLRLGVPLGEASRRATDFVAKFILGGGDKSRLREEIAAIVANPSAFTYDPLRGEFAKALISTPHPGPLPGRGGEGGGAQRIARPTKPKPYSTWCYQLAAYRAALGVRATCLNLIVNSVTPESPVEHVWTESEMESGLRAFMAARELWMTENDYNPAGAGCTGQSGGMVLTA